MKKIIIGILILPLIFIVKVEGKEINQKYDKIIRIVGDDIEVIRMGNRLNEINKDINSTSFRVNKLNIYIENNLTYKKTNTSFELSTNGKYKNDVALKLKLNRNILSDKHSLSIEGSKLIFPKYNDKKIKYLRLSLNKQIEKEKLLNLKYKKFIKILRESAKYIQIKENYNLYSKRYKINKWILSRKMKSNKLVGINNERVELKLDKLNLELLKIDKKLSSISKKTRKFIKENSSQYLKSNLYIKNKLKDYVLNNLYVNKKQIFNYKKELYKLQKLNNNKKILPEIRVTKHYQNQPKDIQLGLEISLTNSSNNIKLENKKLKNKIKLAAKQKLDYIENLGEKLLLLKKKKELYQRELNILNKEQNLLEKELIKLKQNVENGYNNKYEIKLKEIDIRLKENDISYFKKLNSILSVEKSILLKKISGIKEDLDKSNLSYK